MNRAIRIIGVSSVGVVTFYLAAVRGKWAATTFAVAFSLPSVMIAFADCGSLSHRRVAAGANA